VFSTSKVDTIIQGHPDKPEYLYLANVSVTSPSTIELKYHVDKSLPFKDLRIVYFNGDSTKKLLYNHVDGRSISLPYSKDKFIINVYDTCDNKVLSDTAQTILLQRIKNDNIDKNVTLSWNAYSSWNAGVDYYEVYRKTDYDTTLIQIIDAGNLSTYEYTDDVSEVKGGVVYYYVIAYENTGNIYGFQESSKSNNLPVYLSDMVPVFFPTGFYPKSDILENKTYKPIYAHADGDVVEWRIYNKLGQVVYSFSSGPSGDEVGWDGKDAQVGSYIYIFTLIRNNKRSFYRGSFVLLR
jgi:hypothetical protein